MQEMITDDRSGWLADNQDSHSLAGALRRALGTAPEQLAQMGTAASSDIRVLCDNKTILERHLAFRDEVCRTGVRRSHLLPVNLPWVNQPLSNTARPRVSASSSKQGIGLVVRGLSEADALFACFHSIKQQTRKPETVVVVKDRTTPESASQRLPHGWVLVESDSIQDPVATYNLGIKTLLKRFPGCTGVAFLRGDEQLHPEFIATCESILSTRLEVGLVSCWASRRYDQEQVWMRPCPSLPYQWTDNDAGSFSVIRREALADAENFRPAMRLGYANWDLFNAILVAGWVGVTVPRILVEQSFREELTLPIHNPRAHGRMREEMLRRFPDVIARDACDIVSFLPSGLLGPILQETVLVDRQIMDFRRIFANPYLTTRWALKKIAGRIGFFRSQRRSHGGTVGRPRLI